MGLGAFLGAAAGPLGSVVSGLFADKAARDNRSFQEKLSNTAHQREVNDLRLAGLNPILSAGGRGASTPSGSVAQIPDVGKSLSSAFSNYTQRKQANAVVKNTEAVARSTEVAAILDEFMLEHINTNPSAKSAVIGGMIGQKAGVRGPLGAVIGLGTSAGAVKNKVSKVQRSADRMKRRIDKYYPPSKKPSIDMKSGTQFRGHLPH